MNGVEVQLSLLSIFKDVLNELNTPTQDATKVLPIKHMWHS